MVFSIPLHLYPPQPHFSSLFPIFNLPIRVGTVPILFHTWVGAIPICAIVPPLDISISPAQACTLNHILHSGQHVATLTLSKPATYIPKYFPPQSCSVMESVLWSTKQCDAPRPGNHQGHRWNKDTTGKDVFADPKKVYHLGKKGMISDISSVTETNMTRNIEGPSSDLIPSLKLPPHVACQNCTDFCICANVKCVCYGPDFENDSLHSPIKQAAHPTRKQRRSSLKSVHKNSISPLKNHLINPKFSLRSSKTRNSILGPHPSTLLSNLSYSSLTPLPHRSNLSNYHITHKTSPEMSALTKAEEAFIQKFVGLSTDDTVDEIVIVPQNATSSTNWELCLLARIITDRLVLDSPFASSMINAWRVDPPTSIRQVMKNCYLFEFISVEDLNSTLLGGVWTYRGDLVALEQVHFDSDLNLALIESAAVWVLFLNVSINAFRDEGLR